MILTKYTIKNLKVGNKIFLPLKLFGNTTLLPFLKWNIVVVRNFD